MSTDLERNASDSVPDFHVGPFKPEDARGITELFRAVYGEEYPIRLFYSPEEIIRANECGDYISILARTEDGRVIGVQHAFRSAPNSSVYEWGVGLTLKEFRGRGVSIELGRYAVETAAPSRGMETVFGESVCNHLFTQKMSARFAFVDTALEVALMPAETYAKEKTAAGRVAAILQFRTYKKTPHRIFVPARYEQQLRFAYSDLDDEREIALSDASLPRDEACTATQQIFDFAGVCRNAFSVIGSDFEKRLNELEASARTRGMTVFQTWLPSASPSVGEAAEICRSHGYFFGGPLPRWFGKDGFLMQKLDCEPDFEDIQLLSDKAKTIFSMVRDDYRELHSRRSTSEE